MNQNNDNSNPNENEKNPFSLPDGYFNSFSKKMMLKIELADELKEFELLSSIDKTSPFITPENYFAQSASSAEIKAELSNYENLVGIRKQNAFATPPFYFQQLPKAIENKIELAQELELYTTLNAIEKQNAFNLPQGYFENVSYAVRGKIFAGQNNQSNFGRVIQLVFSKKTVYAMAAMLVLSFGLYFYNSNNEVTGNCNGLACLDRSEILKSNQINNLDEESLMNLVDPKILEQKLKEASKDSDKKEETNYAIENTDINDL